jgi:hypothetical protein
MRHPVRHPVTGPAKSLAQLATVTPFMETTW